MNAHGPQQLAIVLWEKAFGGQRLTAAQRAEYVSRAIAAADQALRLDADDVESLTWKTLLLRIQATAETDLEQRQTLIAEAETLRNRAEELARTKASGLT